jgi:hypothetical protein
MTYGSETVAIDRLKSTDYLTAVGLLGIQPWVTKLDELNTLFKTYVGDAAEEQLLKPDITPRTSRSESDERLREITNRVESLVNINGEKDFLNFIEEFNIHNIKVVPDTYQGISYAKDLHFVFSGFMLLCLYKQSSRTNSAKF